jgi:hypothetical protein
LKRIMVVVLLLVVWLGCTRDKTPLASIEVIQPEWRPLMIRDVETVHAYVIIKVWDRIENELLKEIRCVDPNTNEIFAPVSWEYSYSQKDAHVYLVILTLEDWQKRPRFEGR